MYFAIQAKNLVDERYNHKYYKLYKRCVRKTNRMITWLTGRGKNRFKLKGAMDDMHFDVFTQISDELRSYGYRTEIRDFPGDTKDPHSYYALDIRWD